jgi:hypothetical protein
VYIASFTQGRRMVSSRLLLGSVLEVNAEIKTIKSMLQSAVNGLSNKAALDASFVQAGLPASTALKTQLYCGAGQYSAQAASSCTMCSVGTYSSVVGLVTSCQSCAVGQFANSSGSTKCSSVTSGYSRFQIKFYPKCAVPVVQHDRYTQAMRTLLTLVIAGSLISASADPAANGSSNMGVIIGAAAGGAVAAMVALGFSWRFYVNRKRKILVPDNNKTVLGADKEVLSASLVAIVDGSDDFDHQVWIREKSSSLGCMMHRICTVREPA